MIGFISDTHGSFEAWKLAMSAGLAQCDYVIHAGDVLYHGPRNPLPSGHNPQELAKLINNSGLNVLIAKGNCDASIDQMLIDYPICSPAITLHHDNMSILAHHGDSLTDDDIRRFINASHVALVVSGHTHLRSIQKIDGVVYLNPGSCSLPKDEDHIPTFATLSDGIITIRKIIDGSALQNLKL